MAPISYVIVAYFFLPFFYDGKDEVYIRMYQLIPLYAGGTSATGVCICTVRATDVTGISHCQRKLSHSRWTAEELGMRNTPLLHFLPESLFGCFLSYYLFEKHDIIYGFINYNSCYLISALVYQFCNFFYTVHCTDGIEVNAGYSMFH